MEKRKFNLKESGVVFNEEAHTYHLGDRLLGGITGVINKHIFPDKYSGVPESVLNKRAAFGSDFHSDMEIYINLGIESSSDTFKVFKDNYSHIRFTQSEYIVTDGKHFASPIDAIDEDCILYDFKTSSKKDVEYWRWQLGFYAYLFELQNGFKPNGYRVMWINKELKHELVEIEPVGEERIKALILAEVTGTQYVDPDNDTTALIPDARIQAVAAMEKKVSDLDSQLKAAKSEYDTMKAALLELFNSKGVKSWETDVLKISVKESYTRSSVDSDKLKKDHEDIYNECLKTTTVKQSLIIKIKK